ncbi:MAG: helix-turn-helix domain-containing protein [Bdellovibrionales bacterium]|nr:helix-turn-helix domain-containing protein [Bdellovibrionales bacterium]
MGRSTFYLVSDDYQLIEETKNFYQHKNVDVQVFSSSEWQQKMGGQSMSLSSGASTVDPPSNVIPFPGQTVSSQGVQTINQLESVAIENAIHEFKGNLTEAAKALGIGRATLYRKVKQYNINPSLARSKKRAA